jgi:hypothetical protein
MSNLLHGIQLFVSVSSKASRVTKDAMAPAQNGETPLPDNFQVVAWDLDTTGRRLIDEICQVTLLGAVSYRGGGLAKTEPRQNN